MSSVTSSWGVVTRFASLCAFVADKAHGCRFYLAVLRGMNRGIKQVNTSYRTQITTSGWINYGYNDLLVEHGFDNFDIIAYDWYSDMGDLNNTSSWCGQGADPSGCSRPGPGANVLAKLLSFNKSIWIGETNRRGGSVLCDAPKDPSCRNATALQQEAAYLSHELNLIKQYAIVHPLLEAAFVYELLDQPEIQGVQCGKPKGSLCGEGHYGLIEVEEHKDGAWVLGHKKPA